MDGAASPAKFDHPLVTADGARRATVALSGLRTLWFFTGTLCNIECAQCYVESSPRNDSLAYLSADEVARYLDEAAALGWPLGEVGFTGGEPFLNPQMIAMAEAALSRGLSALILTNAMKPMRRPRVARALAGLAAAHGARLGMRVSLDSFEAEAHDRERGVGAFAETLAGLRALRDMGARLAVAGRLRFAETEAAARAGYAALFAREGLALDADDPAQLVLFPEMESEGDPPEITEACWDILGKSPDSVMCASARMVVKRRGAHAPSVVACTLLPQDARFELGETLAQAARPVALNHPWCATFCVLGGARCSG